MKRTYLVLIITMLVVGFAAVATNLAINGNINIGFNQKKFEEGIVFTYADTDTGEASISEDAKTITFTSSKLENINQEAVLEYDVANKALQYDANVTVTCKFDTDYESYDEWLSIENDLSTPFTLGAGETETGNLKVKLIKAYNDGLEKDVNIKCELVASPGERVEEKEYVPTRTYVEKMLHGAEPVLSNKTTEIEAVAMDLEVTLPKELVPVKIGEKGTVTYADIYSEWYNYEEKEWANAVILTNEGVNKNFKAGDIIDEEYIESYFVWIPKYRYKIFDMGDTYTTLENDESALTNKSREIEIEFGIENTIDSDTECVAPNKSGENGSCAVDKWMTHPAFTSFGDIKGFWVGKFETGYKDANENTFPKDDTSECKSDANVNVNDASQIIIKPNSYSWRCINIANMYNNSYEYQRSLDSHMMKNTEWGAVAYLSHSKYGTCDGKTCTEIRINNSKNYATGYAAMEKPTLGTHLYEDTEEVTLGIDGSNTYNYKNSSSTIASTTGNYTGIYDMTGGSWESVMAIPSTSSDYKFASNTGFTDETKPSGKYVDLYDIKDEYVENNHIHNYNFRILGDATGELGPFAKSSSSLTADGREVSSWNESHAWLNKVFIDRGGASNEGSIASIFAMGPNSGHPNYSYVSFRIVLAPQ